jgi:hypothetical protein
MKSIIISGSDLTGLQKYLNTILKDVNKIIEMKQSFDDGVVVITLVYE